MKKNFPMKCVAAFAMLMLPLPMMFVFEVSTFGGFILWHYLIYYAVAGVVTAAGYMAMSVKRSQHKAKTIFLSNIMIAAIGTVLTILVPIVSTAVNNTLGEYTFNVFNFSIALMPSVVVWYLLGLSLRKNSFDEVYTPVWLGIYLVETFMCYIFCCAMSEDKAYLNDSKTKIVVLLIVMALLTVLLINQTNIQSQIDRRRNTNLIVPKGLKLYNAKLISIVGAVILVALLLKDYVAAGLKWLVQMTLKIIDTLIFNIRFQQTDSLTPEDTQLPDSDIFSTEQGNKDFLIYILVIVVVVLIIVFRKKIIGFFKKIAKRFFGKFSVDDSAVNEYVDYTDSYETLDIKQEKIVRETKKDCLKKYRKTKDKTEKFRLGYRLYIMWLAERSTDNISAMTVEQQRNVSDKLYHGTANINELSGSYNRVRYDDENPNDNDMTSAEHLIDELYK